MLLHGTAGEGGGRRRDQGPENRILRNQLKGRIRLSDAERKALAVMGQKLGQHALKGVAQIVKPETILGWHRTLVAQKFDPKTRTVVGGPIAMPDAPAAVANEFMAGHALSVSATNTLAYLEHQPNTSLVWMDQSGTQVTPVAVPAARYVAVSMNRAGSQAVLIRWTSPTSNDQIGRAHV